MSIRVDPVDPIANGILFDVLDALSPADTAEIIYSGLVYGTCFTAKGRIHSGTIIARDMEQGEARAEVCGRGEVVDGLFEGERAA